MYRKALDISTPLDDQEGLARAYTNLGTVYERRGDLVEAEQVYRKALDIVTLLE